MKNIDNYLDDFERALLNLDHQTAYEIVKQARVNSSPMVLANELITLSLERIGQGWEQGRFSLSQVYMAGSICESIIDDILPPNSPQRKDQPRAAIGVFEDYHMLGKRIVYSFLRASGIELLDLGGGLSLQKTVDLVEKHQIKILLLSVLMLPSALKVAQLVDALKDHDVKIVVGGAPFRFDPELGKEIGAYAIGKDSGEALEIMHKIMEENHE